MHHFLLLDMSNIKGDVLWRLSINPSRLPKSRLISVSDGDLCEHVKKIPILAITRVPMPT